MPHFTSPRDAKTHNMNDITSDFACLKVSALCKASRVSKDVRRVTIGPDSIWVPDQAARNENIENEPDNKIVKEIKSDPHLSSPKPSTRNGITFSIKKILLENELQRREEVRLAMQRRLQSMEESERALQKQMALLRDSMIAERERQERLEEDELVRLEAEEEHLAQQTENRRKHEQRLHTQRILERKEKLEREAEEQRKKNKERRALVEKMIPLQASFRAAYQDISSVSKSCKDRNVAGPAFAPYSAKLKELSKCMEGLVEHAKTGDLTEENIGTAEVLVKHSEDILNAFRHQIEQINTAYDTEIARREEEIRRVEAQKQVAQERVVEATVTEAKVAEERLAETAQSQPPSSTGEEPQKLPPDDLLEFVDKESLNLYLNSQQLLENYKNMIQSLIQSDSTKKFRFECQKAINIPVNAISGVSREHLFDKYDKLSRLLGGKPPTNANQHPQGIAFCKYTLAKKFVSQGETLVSSKPETAFSVAAVAIALWNDYPDFGELLLAYFQNACPYLVPIFLPQQQSQSNDDYYKSLGYKYSEDGTVERQDKFLKRMSGLMRLYAAMTITSQSGHASKPHPHGLQNAWRWLAAILNIEPRPDVCATLILDMLEVAGSALWKTYPNQFPKMLTLLAGQYFPRMQTIGGTCGGPMARLEQFLKNSLTAGSISPPEGKLPPSFLIP
ncbi:mRNA export factor Gle1 [Athalia rosae]|uniref:mRNA export factor Gle1 n=1 Tax=Athalia rosae TaxID=37344 RepID=UPI00203381ED|nr:mRNA export factor Gle1 [Athalia rosae]